MLVSKKPAALGCQAKDAQERRGTVTKSGKKTATANTPKFRAAFSSFSSSSLLLFLLRFFIFASSSPPLHASCQVLLRAPLRHALAASHRASLPHFFIDLFFSGTCAHSALTPPGPDPRGMPAHVTKRMALRSPTLPLLRQASWRSSYATHASDLSTPRSTCPRGRPVLRQLEVLRLARRADALDSSTAPTPIRDDSERSVNMMCFIRECCVCVLLAHQNQNQDLL